MKKTAQSFVIASIILFLFACGKKEEKRIEKKIIIKESNLIDLTYTFDSTSLYWPNNVCGEAFLRWDIPQGKPKINPLGALIFGH